MRLRTDDDVPAVHEDHVIAAPFRIDIDDPLRQRMESNRAGDGGANRDVEVDVADLFDPLRLDGGDDLGALLGRRGCGRRGGGVARRLRPVRAGTGLGIGIARLAVAVAAFGRVAGLAVAVAITAFGSVARLAVPVTIAALGSV